MGVDALGKPDTFDAQSDPSVRVLALRLRKTLSEVYENMHGCNVVIDLRVGTYVPSFYKVAHEVNSIEVIEDDASFNGMLGASENEPHREVHAPAMSVGSPVVKHATTYNQVPPNVAVNTENSVHGAKR